MARQPEQAPEPLPLNEARRRIQKIQQEVPEFKDREESEIAQFLNRETGGLFQNAEDPNPLLKTRSNIDLALQDVAKPAGEFVEQQKFLDNVPFFDSEDFGTATENTIAGATDIGTTLLQAAGRTPRGRILLGLGNLGSGILGGLAETDDRASALTTGLAQTAAPPVASRAAALGRGSTLARGAAGAGAGGLADVAEIAGLPRQDSTGLLDRAGKNVTEFFSDPDKVKPFLLQQAPFAALDFIGEGARARQFRRDQAVGQQRGVVTEGGRAENLINILQDDFQINVPRGVDPAVLRQSVSELRNVGPQRRDQVERAVLSNAPQQNLSEVQRRRLEQLKEERDRVDTSVEEPRTNFSLLDERLNELSRRHRIEVEEFNKTGRSDALERAEELTRQAAREQNFVGPLFHFSRSSVPFRSFELEKAPEGFHFGTRQAAQDRAKVTPIENNEGQFTKAFIKADRIIDIEDRGNNTPVGVADQLLERGFIDEQQHETIRTATLKNELEQVDTSNREEFAESIRRQVRQQERQIGREIESPSLEIQRAAGDKVVFRQTNQVEDRGSPSFFTFNPNLVKSAEGITQDQQGNVVPLDERFDTSSADINFSRAQPEQSSSTVQDNQQAEVKVSDREFNRAFEQFERIRQNQDTIPLSIRQFLDRALGRQNVRESDVIGRFLARLASPSTPGIRGFRGDETIGGAAVDRTPFINLDISENRTQVATAAHEMSHVAMNDLRVRDPELFQQVVNEASEMEISQVRVLFDEIKETTQAPQMNPRYLSGIDFDQNASNFREQIAFERIAGVAEGIVHDQLTRRPQLTHYFDFLPLSFQRTVADIVDRIRKWFGDGRMENMLSPQSRKTWQRLNQIVQNKVLRSERAGELVRDIMNKTENFNFHNLPDVAASNDPTVFTPNSESLSILSKPFSDMNGNLDLKKVEFDRMSGFQKHVWSGIAKTKIFPVTRKLFDSLHMYRPEIMRTMSDHMASLGQNREGNLPPQEAIENFQNQIREISKSNKKQKDFGWVFRTDQERREQAGALDDVVFGEDQSVQLVTDEEMRQRGMAQKDIDLVHKLRDMTRLMARQEMNWMSNRDALDFARFIFTRFSDTLSKDQAEEIGRFMSRHALEIGRAKFMRDEALRKFQNNQNEQAGSEVERRRAQHNARREEAQSELTQLLTDQGVNLGPQSNQVLSTAINLLDAQGEYRVKHWTAVAKEGYAPQVRRRKFLLRYKVPDEDQPMGFREVARDFNKESEAREFFKKQKQEAGAREGTISSKDNVRSFYRHYSSQTIQSLRNDWQRQMNSILGEAQQNLADSPETLQVITDLRDKLGDLDTELSDALSTKADPFKLQRKNTEGFRDSDYLPNLFNYLQVKTIIGLKGVTQSRAKLEMEQPEFRQNPELLEETQRQVDYTLNSKDTEWQGIRRATFYYYLAASLRHLMQNLTQPFIVGMPEQVRQLGSVSGAARSMPPAYRRIQQWVSKGDSGDETLNRLFKQAEDEGVWNPSMIEHYLPTDEAGGPNSIKLFLSDKSGFRQAVDQKARDTVNGVQSIFRSTAEASEIMNRQVSFAMRVIGEINKRGKNKQFNQEELLEIFQEGRKFANDVNFIGDKANRPGFLNKVGLMHGPIMMATALQSFFLNHVSLIASYWNEWARGSVDPVTFKRNSDAWKLSNPGFKALATSVGALMGAAGVLGLPFAENMDDIMEDITGTRPSSAARRGLLNVFDNLDMIEDEGSFLTDAIFEGLPTAAGIDVSGSIGLGRFFNYQTGQPLTMWQLMGATGGVLKDAVGAANTLSTDPLDQTNWQDASKFFEPFGIQYWRSFINAAQRNAQFSRTGGIIEKGLGVKGSLAVLSGFRPTEVSKQRSSEFKLRRMKQRQQEKRNQTVRRIVNRLEDFRLNNNNKALSKAQDLYLKYVTQEAPNNLDVRRFVQSISDDLLARFRKSFETPGVDVQRMVEKVQEAYPNFRYPVQSSTTRAIDRVRTAQQLGDPVNALRNLQTLQNTGADKITEDALQQAGINPAIIDLVLNSSKVQPAALQNLPNARLNANSITGRPESSL